jgi:hypothetical protein
MIISFKPQFVPKILAGTKIHTLREDKTNRWQTGRKMHMYTGRYTATDRQFIKEAECVSVQYVEVNAKLKLIYIGRMEHVVIYRQRLDSTYFQRVRELTEAQALQFARNDGFDTLEDFWQWFTTTKTLKLIHWTDKRY